jgi:hypothetical protein
MELELRKPLSNGGSAVEILVEITVETYIVVSS